MKFKKLAYLILSMGLGCHTVAWSAPINDLQNQLNQLDQAIQAMPNGDPEKAKQYINQLIAIANQLKTINKKDDAWKKAATDYNRLNQLAVTKARTAPSHLANQPADPETLDGLKKLVTMEADFKKMSAGDVNKANQMLGELKAMIPVINGAKNKYHPKWQELREKYNQLNNAIVAKAKQAAPIQRQKASQMSQTVTPSGSEGVSSLPSYMQARFKRIKRNVDGTTAQINNISSAELTDPRTVDGLQQRIQRQINDVAKLEPQSNKAIVELTQQLKDTQQLLADKQKASQQSVAGFGDIKTRVAQIDQNMQTIRVPKALFPPLDEKTIKNYMQQVQTVEQHVKNDLGYLQQIDGKTQLVSKGTMSRLKHWIGSKPRELKQSLSTTTQSVDSWVEKYTWQTKRLDKTDPAQRKDRLQLLQRDYLDKTVKELETGINAVKIAQIFDNQSQRQNPPDREQQLTALQKTRDAIQQKFDQALKLNTIRKPQSTSEKLLKIARETLSRPKYGVNHPIERMVINYDIHTKQKKTTEIENDSLVTYYYKWDEFQVTTAEKVGEKYYLFSNMLKYYHSGDNVTPTDKWILSDRFEGMQILKENIHK